MNNKLQLTSRERPCFAEATQGERGTGHGSRKNAGSALIIAVILTSLLAIIGVMFVMIARVDKMATSAISENKELNFAVETVVAKISQELVLDVPGVAGQEYYDYPDANNAWLADLEPYQSGSDYYWRRISDIYSRLDANNLQAEIIPDYQKPSDVGDGSIADADGDGVADSKWVELEDINSNKGKPIYAAIRVVDNGAMINVNTAYKFNPAETDSSLIDGSSQLQIDLAALARGDADPDADTIGELNVARGLSATPTDLELSAYEDGLIWRIEDPYSAYLPFDISDELTIRGRYIIKQKDTITRLKRVWEFAFDRSPGYAKERPYIDTDTDALRVWFEKSYRHLSDPGIQQYYNMPHISTTYNIDRIIKPDCNKMAGINSDSNALIYEAIKSALGPGYTNVEAVAAQIAVNIVDYRDSDSDVNVYTNPDDGITYYGFEQPCIYISELTHRFKLDPAAPGGVYESYAVELYKPYSVDDDPVGWQLQIGGTTFTINNWTGNKQFYVILNQNTNAPLKVDPGATVQPETFTFNRSSEISLLRPLPDGSYVTVDWYQVDPAIPSPPWLSQDDTPHSIQRDIRLHKCIRRVWASVARNDDSELGKGNTFGESDPNVIQAHPANSGFTNVGEIGMIFRKGAYYINAADRPDRIGYGTNNKEKEVRLDLADPCYHNLFQYLTVFDPNSDTIDNDGDGFIDALDINTPEYKVPGRININTAPWYVLAQLPWVSQKKGSTDSSLAQAIVAYRDKLNLSPDGPDYDHGGAFNSRETETSITGLREEPGFASIGELAAVVNNTNKDNYSMSYYILDVAEKGIDLAGFPDLTPGDNAIDDFEERDVIFSRISNLVTVRSDVFTAYILVRIGTDGPQKRVMAILDRSNVRKNPDYDPTATNSIPYLGEVRTIAIHPVPDPR